MAASLEVYAHLPVATFATGECVIRQGSQTGRLFILIEGRVEIVKDDKTVAASAQPGDIFGDLSALLDIPHTTSVRAAAESRFYIAENARDFLAQHPTVCMHLCELLAQRLVSATGYLANLKEQFAGHDHIGMVDEVLEKLIHRHPRKRIPPRDSTVNIPEIAD